MATRLVTTDGNNYTEVSTQSCLVFNRSSYNLRLIFKDSLPTPEDDTFFILSPNKAVVKNNDFPDGNLYAMSDKVSQEGVLSVSE